MRKILVATIFVLSLRLSCLAVFSRQFSVAHAIVSSPESSIVEEQSPQELIQRAIDALGLGKTEKMIHLQAIQATEGAEQSDRSYPPFFSNMASLDIWYDPQSGVERDSTQRLRPGSGPGQTSTSVFGPSPTSIGSPHKLNVFTTLLEWKAAEGVRVAGREVYRDYERIVLARQDGDVEERLFLDPKTGFPVKLDRVERHYLWGQLKIEFVYSDWLLVENLYIPTANFQVTDGETTISRTIGKVELVARDKLPNAGLPEQSPKLPGTVLTFKELNQPKTVQVGPATYLLVSRAYTETVTLIGDTVYLLDATTDEERAKNDTELIQQLFPGKHPVVVVVTDLAWPHIAGVRYWVASGATIISHKSSHDFLTKIVERRWTLAPDQLEKSRNTSTLKFTGVDGKYVLANGKIQIYPIDGISTECALMVYLPDDHFLWASDYIQNLREPSIYAIEVAKAAQRFDIHPERFAAEHVPLNPWSVITELLRNRN